MSKTIALVDDEEVFHWITKQFIEKLDESIQIISFYNGREALDHLKSGQHIPDVLMVDLNMPVVNGWIFLNEFSELNLDQDITIYVVSSSIDPEDQKRAQSYAHVTSFVSKPLSMEFLEKALN